MHTQDFNCHNCEEKFHTNICLCSCSLCHEQFCQKCFDMEASWDNELRNKPKGWDDGFWRSNNDQRDYSKHQTEHKGTCEPKCFTCGVASTGICETCQNTCRRSDCAEEVFNREHQLCVEHYTSWEDWADKQAEKESLDIQKHLILACQAQNMGNIQKGRDFFKRKQYHTSPKHHTALAIEREVDACLDVTDEWQARRLAELYDLLEKSGGPLLNLCSLLYKQSIRFKNHELAEIAKEFSGGIKCPACDENKRSLKVVPFTESWFIKEYVCLMCFDRWKQFVDGFVREGKTENWVRNNMYTSPYSYIPDANASLRKSDE